jgi:hypothetical protein
MNLAHVHSQQAKQVFIYGMCVIGHAVILLLSAYWFKVSLLLEPNQILTITMPLKLACFTIYYGVQLVEVSYVL